MKSWQDIRDKKFSIEELRAIDQEVKAELHEMDLRALREAAGLPEEELAAKSSSLSSVGKQPRRGDGM